MSNRFSQLLKRDRRPGDLVFSIIFVLLALFLVSQLGEQTEWIKSTILFAQPAFWPAISLIGMLIFAALNLLSSMSSQRIEGRKSELTFWVRSVEFAIWFLIYVFSVPVIGYLFASLLFMLGLTFRLGYRGFRIYAVALASAFSIVLVFKTILRVNIPGGRVYEYLPDALRHFMILNF